VIVRFVDTSGILDYHCLNFLLKDNSEFSCSGI